MHKLSIIGFCALGLLACSESSSGPDNDTLASLSCLDGYGPVWSDDEDSWTCAEEMSLAGSGVATTAARSDHNHDSDYIGPSHNHDTDYAAITHLHDAADIDSGLLVEARIPESIARTSGVFATVLASDGSGTGLDADTIDGRDSSEFVSTSRIVIISPSATATESGSAVADRIAAIADASETNPYLVWLEPGVYDMGSNSLEMKDWVSVMGSGQRSTRVTSTVGSFGTGTINLATNTTLSRLTVENTSTANFVVAVATRGTGPMTISDTSISIASSPNNASGISQGSGDLTVERVKVNVNGNFSNGITSQNGTAVIRDCSFTVSGGAEIAWALWTNGGATAADILVINSILKGPQGIRLGSSTKPAVVSIHNSVVEADGDAADLLDAATELNVGNSMFEGSLDNAGGGTFRCFGSYNASFASACL